MSRPSLDVYITGLIFAGLLAVGATLPPLSWPAGVAVAAALAAMLLGSTLAWRLRQLNAAALLSGFLGCVAGACLGLLFAFILLQSGLAGSPYAGLMRLALPLLGGYIGLFTGAAKGRDFWRAFGSKQGANPNLSNQADSTGGLKLLDTSVLIDGRIADIGEAGFLEGRLVVPQFVLHELQLVADSADSAKRNRGRRGLDVVQHLQKLTRIQVEVSTQDFPAIREVDLKLIEFAKLVGAKIVTNDFNLNKLAQVQGLEVLNINELANALKPVVLPGETMRVFILKEGKEHNQGVAYLDDGTMVVVDNARRMISKNVDIVVTSVLQTTAGKMIFGRCDERAAGSSEPRSSAASAGTATS